MKYRDLRDFLSGLEQRGELLRITEPVDPKLEMTDLCDRVLRKNGPALLFENPTGFDMPVLGNLFGTPERVAMGMGAESLQDLREIGQVLSYLKEPDPPKGLKDAWDKAPLLKKVLSMAPKTVRKAACQEEVFEGPDVDLGKLPVWTCWPEDAAPLITWPLVITQGPQGGRVNLGIYRQQVIGKNKLIMRWLSHRGGALDFQAWQQERPGEPFPIAVALGADPATILGAVTPVPDSLSEYAFAGLLRDSRTELVKCGIHDLKVPASAEIILEGFLYPGETAEEGPYGDHTGYYNETETFPVFTVERMYLPPEGCSYRLAVVSMKKQYAGHAKRVMMGVWSFLRQFMYTKYVIVVDDDVDARDWKDVIWAMTTRMDPKRDTVLIDNTPIDYLDFASPVAGLGSKMGMDATNKWPGETNREWGKPIAKDPQVSTKVDELMLKLGL